MKLLVADKRKRVDPNIPNEAGDTALSKAAKAQDVPMLELLLADDRTTCARPFFSPSNQAYDVALRNVKRRRNARFRGLVRFVFLLEATATPATTTLGTTTPGETTPATTTTTLGTTTPATPGTTTPATTTPRTTTPGTAETPEREGRIRSEATCSGVGRGAGMADTP